MLMMPLHQQPVKGISLCQALLWASISFPPGWSSEANVIAMVRFQQDCFSQLIPPPTLFPQQPCIHTRSHTCSAQEVIALFTQRAFLADVGDAAP